MMHKFAFEAVDRTLRDITQVDKPFGGKIFIFGGDFRQILPVVSHGTRADIVSASLCHSPLWKYMKIMKLTINMRLCQLHDSQNDFKQKEFADLLLKIGDGRYPTNTGTEDLITLPLDIIMSNGNLVDLIDFVYPNLAENIGNVNYMVSRAILTPKNADVNMISNIIIDRLPGEMKVYPSADSTDLAEGNHRQQPQLYSPEFLRSLKISDLPPGELKLKVGIPIILLRNLNPLEGLCNGTRLIVHNLQSKVIDAEIITGSHIGKRVFIPRITLSPSENNLPFVLKRLQFPVRVAFSMTINKSQGQTLIQYGVYLPQPVFVHGQLYVALSRATSYQCIKILIICNDHQNNHTRNIVYKEIFQSIYSYRMSL
jgi:ATP-dependent exoDNAse (exonuclease V), alpha subunit - helicase superfamily I member